MPCKYPALNPGLFFLPLKIQNRKWFTKILILFCQINRFPIRQASYNGVERMVLAILYHDRNVAIRQYYVTSLWINRYVSNECLYIFRLEHFSGIVHQKFDGFFWRLRFFIRTLTCNRIINIRNVNDFCKYKSGRRAAPMDNRSHLHFHGAYKHPFSFWN